MSIFLERGVPISLLKCDVRDQIQNLTCTPPLVFPAVLTWAHSSPGCSRTGSVAQAGLRLVVIFQPVPPECWDYRPGPSLLALQEFVTESPTLKWLRQSLGLGDPRTYSVSSVAATLWTGYCSTPKEEKTLFLLWVWGCLTRCGPRVWILDSGPASPVKA